MSDITIAFTEGEVREMVEGGRFPRKIRDKFEAALPPEYPEGTIAWVTRPFGDRCLAVWIDGKWRSGPGQPYYTVTKVEPLRVLKDDEIAVKRQSFTRPEGLRAYAKDLCQDGYHAAVNFVNAYADALDAEQK